MVNPHYGKLEIIDRCIKKKITITRVTYIVNNLSIWHPISGLKVGDCYKNIQTNI